MIFQKKPPKLRSYHDVSLETMLADPLWADPIREARFEPGLCDLVLRVATVLVADPGVSFANGQRFLAAAPAVLLAQDSDLGLAVPDERQVLVLRRPATRGRLMLTTRGAIQIVFGSDGSQDGWTFTHMKKATEEGSAFGSTLLRFVASG